MTAKEACTFEEIRAYASGSLSRLFTDAAGYWGQRARAHMAAGFPEMAYETAYTAAHCGRLALAQQVPITEADRQQDGRR